MHPGDVLYLPKSMVHFATTEPDVVSAHLTMSIERSGRTWQDMVVGMCYMTGHPLCSYFDTVLQSHVRGEQGLPWLDLVDDHAQPVCDKLHQLVLSFHNSSLRSALSANAAGQGSSYASVRSKQQLLYRLGQCHAELGVGRNGASTVVQAVLQDPKRVILPVHWPPVFSRHILQAFMPARSSQRQRRDAPWTPPCSSTGCACNSCNAKSCK